MPRIKVTIDGTDYTDKLIEQTFSIKDSDGPSIDVLELEFDDREKVMDINNDVDVLVEEYTSATTTRRRFGGLVSEISTRPEGYGRVVRVMAQDWKVILEKSSMVYKSTSRLLDVEVIQAIFQAAEVAEFDIRSVADGGKVSSARTLDPVSFNGNSIHDVLSQIAEIAGATWDVNAYKQLIYEVPGTRYASFQFIDNPTLPQHVPYQDVEATRLAGQYNAVEIRGGKLFSFADIEVHAGDGTTKEHYSRNISLAPEDTGRVEIGINVGTELAPVWQSLSVALEGEGGSFLIPSNRDVTWNPIQQKILFRDAPPNLSNAWRINGRYLSLVTAQEQDDDAIRKQGRRFQKTIDNANIKTQESAISLAQAFLRENGPVEHVQLVFFADNLQFTNALNDLELGQFVSFTNEALNYNRMVFRLNELTTSILGGYTQTYRVMLGAGAGSRGSGRHTFDHLMMELRRKATDRERPDRDEEAYYQIRRTAPRLTFREVSATAASQRGPYRVGTARVGRFKVV